MKRVFSIILLCTSVFFVNGQTNLDLRAIMPLNDNANDIWGYVDSLGNEYAIVGLKNSTKIIDVTDPENPVSLHTIPGPNSTWRDIKTWGQYAYVTNETSNGLLIIDLAGLPATIATKETNFNAELETAHNIFIDEKGFAYCFGYNDSIRSIPTDERGAYIIDLRTDPWNPSFAGRYASAYVHDGFVRNDTMWVAQIYAGTFAAVDVSTKANLVVMANQETPSRFTHNSWLTDDGKYIVNSDEVSSGFISFYDVSDLDNIAETDRYQAVPGSGLIPHNAFVFGDYVVVSYYKHGVVILDATKKNNVIEVGGYDTSPFIASDGFNGCWGVYPYLPSGNIIASDIEEGLFILTPTFQRACYLEGNVTQTNTGGNLGSVKVDIIGTDNFDLTGFNGNYLTGIGTPGDYDVRFSRAGCSTQIFTNITLTAGQTVTLNADLQCNNLTDIAGVDATEPYLTAKPSVFSGHTAIGFYTGEFGLSQSSMDIYDMNGSRLYHWEFETATGEVMVGDNLPAGMYLVTINNANFAHSIKILKNQ